MSSPNLGLALASLTAWGLYGYLFSREQRAMNAPVAGPDVDRELSQSIREAIAAECIVSNPRAVHVRATNGYVTLTGDVFWSEANPVMTFVRTRPRVKGVRNHLHAHHSAVGIPSLQGRPFPVELTAASPP